MNPQFAKLQALAKKAGAGAIEPVDITIGDLTERFYFRRIGYLRARELVAMAMEMVTITDESGETKTNAVFNPSKMPERNLILISESLVDENGNPYATKAEIAGLPPEIGDKLFEAAERVNAIKDGAVAEKEKNSEATDYGSTSSNSQTVGAAPSQN